jgi:hypothetical protein
MVVTGTISAISSGERPVFAAPAATDGITWRSM